MLFKCVKAYLAVLGRLDCTIRGIFMKHLPELYHKSSCKNMFLWFQFVL